MPIGGNGDQAPGKLSQTPTVPFKLLQRFGDECAGSLTLAVISFTNMPSTTYTRSTTLIGASLLLILVTIIALPHPAAALSCMNPAELLEQYATQDDYNVALITGGAIETVGDEHNQTITTNTLYKGELGTTDTVSFAFNETWNYLCSGGPAAEGAAAVYVLSDQQVIQVFAPDSELAQDLLALIAPPTTQPTEVTLEDAERETLMRQIIVLLQRVVSLLSARVAEELPG